MPRVYVSVGSNIDRKRNIRGGIDRLDTRFGPLRLSPVYESPAIGFEGDPFYNLVVAFDTEEQLPGVCAQLTATERAFGRTRNEIRFGPRTLDLDLLLYGDLVRHGADVDIPRRDILEYACVLRPLADIAPDLRHPETGETLRELWETFDRDGQPLAPVPPEVFSVTSIA